MIAWAVQRPAVVRAIIGALLLAGSVALARLPLATRPHVEFPRLRIAATWPGASAELVEAHVTAPIEAAVQSLRGVRRVSSQSGDGDMWLTVELEEHSKVQLMRLAVLERLELLRPGFPSGASAPRVGTDVPDQLSEQPLLQYTISGPYTAGTLARMCRERITPWISAVPGVAGVDVTGGAEQGVVVAYDAARLRQLAIAPEALAHALSTAQLRRGVGMERIGAGQRPVIVDASSVSTASLEDLPVLSGARGTPFRLGALAAVRLEEDARDRFYRVNGEPAVGLTIVRGPGTDAIRVAAEVRRTMTGVLDQMAPGIKIRVQSDESVDLARELTALAMRGTIAGFLVVLVLIAAFRDYRPVVLVLASAVVAVAGTALGMYLLHVPANLLTIAGLGMGIGILVHNGVVVVCRLRAVPDVPGERAEAARRITPVVCGATLSTAAVLLPFLYLQGNAGAAFAPFALAFALALGWSTLSAIVMIPALGPASASRSVTAPFFRRAYTHSVVFLLRRRRLALAVVVAVLGVVGWSFVRKVPRFNFSVWWNQRPSLTVRLRFPRGSDLSSLDAGMRQFERIVRRRDGVDQVVAQGSNDGAWLQVSFVRGAEMTSLPYRLQEELTHRAMFMGGAMVRVQYQGPGYASGARAGIPQFRIKLLGYSYDQVERIARDLRVRLEHIPRVRNVDINAGRFWGEERAATVVLEPDRAALTRFGLTVRDLASVVSREVSGSIGRTQLAVDGAEMRVSLRSSGARDRSLDDLRGLVVPNRRGAPVRIGDLARVDERQTIAQIDRENQQYVRTISYEFRGPTKLGERTHKAFLESISVPPGYSVSDDSWFSWGEDDSTKGLWFVFAGGVLLVSLVVAVVLDSIWATARLLLTLPIALTGSAAAFWVTGAAFTREAVVGVILVVGLAGNQAIQLVDAALARRRAAARARRAFTATEVVRAARDRSGMIALVTLTTLASLLPLAVGTDADELFGAIALATLGGTIAGTIAALWILPLLLVRWRA